MIATYGFLPLLILSVLAQDGVGSHAVISACMPANAVPQPLRASFWMDPLETIQLLDDPSLRIFSPGAAGSSALCSDAFSAICSPTVRMPAPPTASAISRLIAASDEAGPGFEAKLVASETAVLARGGAPSRERIDAEFKVAADSMVEFVDSLAETTGDARSKYRGKIREISLVLPSEYLRAARQLEAADAAFSGYEAFAKGEIERSCGAGGWVSNAFHEAYSKKVVLCPGFLLTLGRFSRPEDSTSFLWNVLAHEIGHGLIRLSPPLLPGYSECVISQAPESVPRSQLDPLNLEEIQADYLAGEALAQALKGSSVTRIEKALHSAWSHRCDSQGGPQHPPGSYRIGWGIGRHPALRAALRCPPLTTAQSGCDRISRVPR